MGMVRVDIGTVIVGGGPVASLVVLVPRKTNAATSTGATERFAEPLPIRIGSADASAIGMAVEQPTHGRPTTHALLKEAIERLGGHVTSVSISKVEGMTFYAQVNLVTNAGDLIKLDARPSDAIALALTTKSPMFVAEDVMRTAGCPDFASIKEDELKNSEAEFHEFVQSLSPEDFS